MGELAIPGAYFLLLFGFIQLLIGSVVIARHAMKKKVVHGVLAFLIPPYGIYWAVGPYKRDQAMLHRELNLLLYFSGWIVTIASYVTLRDMLLLFDQML